VIVIVDACHSGGLFYETAAKRLGAKTARAAPHRAWNLADRVTARMKRLRAARLKTNRRLAVKLVAPEEVGWMTACAYSQYSYESEDIGHGWFTHRLIQGFQYGDVTGDGWASFRNCSTTPICTSPTWTRRRRTPIPPSSPPSPAPPAPRRGRRLGLRGQHARRRAGSRRARQPPDRRRPFPAQGPRRIRFYAFQVRRGVTYVFRSTNTAGDGDVDAELYVLADSPQAARS
jgi:hypothetical protein